MISLLSLSVVSGLLYGLSFPPFNISIFAWFFLGPLLSLENHPGSFVRPWVNRFIYGGFCGLIANLLIYFWIWDTFRAAHIGFLTTLNAWLLLSLVFSLYTGSFFALVGLLPFRWFKPFVAGALWVVLDSIKSTIMTGFPWALLSHSQAYFLNLIQIASVTGAAGITFLIVATNSALALLISFLRKEKSQRGFISLVKFFPAPIMTLLIIAWGWFRLQVDCGPSPSLNVAILQGNIDQYQKWDKTYEDMIRDRYEAMVTEVSHVSGKKINLFVWPESATPGWIPNDQKTLDWVRSVIIKSQTYHIVGSVSARAGKEYNSAFLFNPDGDIVAVYDKQHLVPFGEMIPFGGFLSRWIPYLGNLGTFDAGVGPTDFLLPLPECHLSPNICYEAIFPNLIRGSLTEQTDAMVNITNDGWFLTTGAPEQHFVTNIFRAVENGRPVIRVANTGISGVIDGQGRIISRTSLMTTGGLLAQVPLVKNTGKTFYFQWGPWFDWVCWGVTGITVMGLVIKMRKKD